jgi:hypothetical protein
MKGAWTGLEAVPGLVAVPAHWARLAGEEFPALSSLCLQSEERLAEAIPCSRDCGCSHRVVRHTNNDIVAVCDCDPWCCDDFALTFDEITLRSVNASKLGRALCVALECEPKYHSFGPPWTWQIGEWPSAQLPVMLTIQNERNEFRHVVAELVSRLRNPFLLLTPGNRHLTAEQIQLMASVNAASVALENLLAVGRNGQLHCRRPIAEVFASFRSKTPEPPDEDVARRAFELVGKLDGDVDCEPPSLLTIFRLYCIEELEPGQIARRCGCSRSTVHRRLRSLQSRIGLAPDRLRRLSSQFARIENDLTDSRASHIHRQDLIDDADDDDD